MHQYQILLDVDENDRRNEPTYYIELTGEGDTEGPSIRIVRVKHLVSSWFREQNLLSDKEDAMTALITFRNCNQTRQDSHFLTGPMKFNKIKIFGEQKESLKWIKRITINYMSDIDYDKRQSKSSVFNMPIDQAIRMRRSPSTWSFTSCVSGLVRLSINGCGEGHNITYYELALEAQ